ncbi:TonB-dependent receptor [Parashewanella tropica]|uniref:TonB-dependent receptor n=1 Tax=Parashewanella tropica TaxID=2547970 RepID=UPI001478B830|nr:TonB-dependent receptor [Parashewanella tropica]
MKPTYLASVIKLGLMASVIAAPAVVAEEDKVERIVVTGLKIDRELQETPTSVAVVTEKQMEDEQLVSLYDVLDQIPNVAGNFGSDFSIRGVNAFNVSGGGNSYLASVYVDGAALPYRMIQQGGFNVWDVSQVEVLRGPQSTLQGRNALAGAIWITTQQPTYEWSGKARVTVGQHGQRDIAVAGGGELIDNQMAFRFSGEKNHYDGVVRNITRNEKSDYNENQTYRLKLLMEPEAIDGLSATLSYTYNDSEIGVPWVKGPGASASNRITNFNAPTYERTENDIVTLSVNYDFNLDWSLEAISTYLNADYGYEWDGDTGPEDKARLIDDRNDTTTSHELRLIYNGDALNLVFGGYYSNLKVEDKFHGPRSLSLAELNVPTLLVAPRDKGGLGLPQHLAQVVLAQYKNFDPAQINAKGHLNQEVTSAAVYSEFNYRLNEQFAIYGGLRYDYEKQRRESDNDVTIANTDALPDPEKIAKVNPLLARIVTGLNARVHKFAKDASGNEAPVEDSFNKLLPKLGVSYFINDDISTHFTFQQGYRSGGVGRNIARNEIYTYDSEYTNNYELSFRSAWLDNDLTLNANLFLLDWKDMQVLVDGLEGGNKGRFDKYTRNAGKAQVKGFEVELAYSINEEFSFNAGLGQAKSEFKDFSVQVENSKKEIETISYAGQSFAKAPEWTANMGFTYRNADGVFANINANYQDTSAAKLVHNGEAPSVRTNARTIVNARFGYNWENFGVFVTAKNLFDDDYLAAGAGGRSSFEFGKERQLSLNLTAEF